MIHDSRLTIWFKRVALVLLLSTINSQLSSFAQGSLTPPGAPAPTMKSLDQIEPRTPITNLPKTITAPGSYYLVTNLFGIAGTNGITISANEVTLDLNHFTLAGVPGSIDGIVVIGSHTNLWIGNGTIRGWDYDGIDALNSQSSVFTDLKIIGCGNTGFRSGTAARIIRCTSSANSQEGILAFDNNDISRCIAVNNGSSGISAANNCHVTDCETSFNNFDGISAGTGCLVRGCTAKANTYAGISVGDDSVVVDCTAQSNTNLYPFIGGIDIGKNCVVSDCASSDNHWAGIASRNGSGCTIRGCSTSGNLNSGIIVTNNSTVIACTASGNATGIWITGDSGRVEGCNASGNNVDGIDIEASGCLVLNNTCSGNGNGGGSSSGIGSFNGSRNRIEGNHLANNNKRGLLLIQNASTDIIVKNSAPTNTIQTISYDFSTTTNNDVGPIGKAATATSPWANIQ